MREIPIIDISAVLAGHDDTQVVEAFRAAMAKVGFLQIVGHGIAEELVAATHQTLVDLDQMPTQEREALKRPRGDSRGIFERFDDHGHMLQRGFQFIPYDTLQEAQEKGVVRSHPDYFQANVWPEDDTFRRTWKAYDISTRALAGVLMSLFARAFGLPADHFTTAFAHDVTLFSANWYPRQPPLPNPEDRVLLRGHPDSGVLTILHQQGDYEGLQVYWPDGSWVTVPMRPDAFVINIGELMSRWTNGQWPATIHRVIAGPSPDHSRSSVATFFLPNIDEIIEPLASTIGPEGPIYEPISTYDWQQKFMAEYVLATGS